MCIIVGTVRSGKLAPPPTGNPGSATDRVMDKDDDDDYQYRKAFMYSRKLKGEDHAFIFVMALWI